MMQQAAQQTQVHGGPTPQQVPVQQQAPPADAALSAQNTLLQQQVQTLAAQVQQLTQAQQPQQQQVVQPGQAPRPQQEQPRFNFQVPPQFIAGLAAEDEGTRMMTLNSLLNGVAETVAQQLRQESLEMKNEMQGMVQNTVDQTAEMQNVQQDMYGTYPELAAHRAFVQAAARQVGTENPGLQSWSPELRDLIAERVSPMIPGLYQKVQQVRAQRVGSYAIPQQPGQVPQPIPQQPLPQQQAMPSNLPPGVQPVGVMGGVHGQQAPTLARDAQGNLVYVQSPPQPYLGGPQARPDGRGVTAEVHDIWQTLGYAPY
jgi:hypothetical protein